MLKSIDLYCLLYKTMSQRIPMCAKIWEYMLSTSKYESYANNIDDICAKDSLTDPNGLTVILSPSSPVLHLKL